MGVYIEWKKYITPTQEHTLCLALLANGVFRAPDDPTFSTVDSPAPLALFPECFQVQLSRGATKTEFYAPKHAKSVNIEL